MESVVIKSTKNGTFSYFWLARDSLGQIHTRNTKVLRVNVFDSKDVNFEPPSVNPMFQIIVHWDRHV